MNKIQNISYGTLSDSQKLDVYLPDGSVSAAFLYFHGGGLDSGDKKVADVFAPYLNARSIAVISANYRMYPDCNYPDFIYDCALAVKWTTEYMQRELNCKRLYVGGSSAGGYISMMLCFDRRYLDKVGLDNSAICGYFHDAGQPTSHFNVLKNRNTDPRRVIVDETAPLYYIGLEENYPPMRFIVSDNDIKNRYEQTMLVLSTLYHFGYTNYDHIIMHGSHCEYVNKIAGSDSKALAELIYDFINNIENKQKTCV